MTEARLSAGPELAHANDRRACRGHELSLIEDNHPHREELESFVRKVFAARHGARVCSFMPSLLALRNEHGAVCSVAGFRCAADQPLFLECYLDEPIERAIALSCGREVRRSEIVEVGNLAGLNCRSAIRLVLDLPRILLDRGHQWMVFTATDTLRGILANYHAPLLDLAAATASRAQSTGDEWGRYYESNPRVMVGYLADGLRLRRRPER